MANIVKNKVRINFYATARIQGLIEEYTEDLGMNQGAFISMCISEYAKNDKMLQNMTNIQTTLSDLQSLKDTLEKK